VTALVMMMVGSCDRGDNCHDDNGDGSSHGEDSRLW
jgi:hypothetical protein